MANSTILNGVQERYDSVNTFAGHLTGGKPTIRYLTSVDGYTCEFDHWNYNVGGVHIDSGTDANAIEITLSYPGKDVLFDMFGVIFVTNSTAFVRTINFNGALDVKLNGEAVGAPVSYELDAVAGPVDHNRKIFFIFGAKAGRVGAAPHIHIQEIQGNPGALASLSDDPLATGESLITDGIGPDMTLKGIKIHDSYHTIPNGHANPYRLTLTTDVNNDVVLALEEVIP